MGTNLEETEISCMIVSSESGDTFQWFFSNTSGGQRQLTLDGSKYTMNGVDRSLTVKNVSLEDQGYYFCRQLRNEIPLEDLPGGCIIPFSKLTT